MSRSSSKHHSMMVHTNDLCDYDTLVSMEEAANAASIDSDDKEKRHLTSLSSNQYMPTTSDVPTTFTECCNDVEEGSLNPTPEETSKMEETKPQELIYETNYESRTDSSTQSDERRSVKEGQSSTKANSYTVTLGRHEENERNSANKITQIEKKEILNKEKKSEYDSLDESFDIPQSRLTETEMKPNFDITGGSTVNQNLRSEAQDEKNFESFSLVWCDANVSSEENQQIQLELRKAINFLRTFETLEDCVSYVQRCTGEKIVLIVSGIIGKEFMPVVYHFAHIVAIYVYYQKHEECEQWTSGYEKVKGVFTSFTKLIERIAADQKERNQAEKQELPISVFIPGNIVESTHQTLGSDFMWFQLIVEVLLRLEVCSTILAVNDFFQACKVQYTGNERQLAIVNELETDYNSKDAVKWYSRDTFIYRILNRALRQQNIDTLVPFCFLIRDLNQQLQQEQRFEENNIKVYRGQLMSVGELERLRTSQEHFISINTFFSTTLNRNLALIFAGTASIDVITTSVLFEIEVNTRLSGTKPFAAIDHLSVFGSGEEEVLFMLGSIFKLSAISWNEDDNVWIINMELAGDEVDELKPLFHSMRSKIGEETNFLSFGNLFRNMGKYNEAEKFYKRELRSLPERHPYLPRCYGSLGNIARDKGRFNDAYDYLAKALELAQNAQFVDHDLIATVYTNLGHVLVAIEDYENAIEYYSKALELASARDGHDHLDIADICLNIGNVYAEHRNYDLALSNYNQCLEIQRKLLPENHPAIAKTLMNLGNLLKNQGNCDLAMTYYENALSIELKCVPNHTSTGNTYFNIGLLYQNALQNYNKAFINYEKALEIYSAANIPLNHPNRILIENHIRSSKVALEEKLP